VKQITEDPNVLYSSMHNSHGKGELWMLASIML
jgi:hypothetical protein